MVYKLNFIFNIYWVINVTDGVTDDIVWIRGTRMSWFNIRLGPEKRKKANNFYMYYKSYMYYILYISYMHIIYLI